MKQAAQKARSDRFVALRALVAATAFTAFWLGAAAAARRLDGGWTLPGWTPPLGVAVAALGAAVCVPCVTIFAVRGRGTPAPFDPPRQFVVSGPYRFCRNPMVLGFCVMLAGVALCLRSPAALGLAALAFLLGYVMVVAWEEPHLRARFGEAYVDYCRRAPRWIPRWPRTR